VAGFVRGHLGYRFASTKQVAEMTEAFVESIMQFGLDHKIDLVRFKKGQRKDNVMQARLKSRRYRLPTFASEHRVPGRTVEARIAERQKGQVDTRATPKGRASN
jgi:2,3-bisphosphoglycerate-independent phosphoglycerate mutase